MGGVGDRSTSPARGRWRRSRRRGLGPSPSLATDSSTQPLVQSSVSSAVPIPGDLPQRMVDAVELVRLRLISAAHTLGSAGIEHAIAVDQAVAGLVARVVTQYDDATLSPPAYFHPTVGESLSSPDAKGFLKAAHLFAGTWIDANRERSEDVWATNRAPSSCTAAGQRRGANAEQRRCS